MEVGLSDANAGGMTDYTFILHYVIHHDKREFTEEINRGACKTDTG